MILCKTYVHHAFACPQHAHSIYWKGSRHCACSLCLNASLPILGSCPVRQVSHYPHDRPTIRHHRRPWAILNRLKRHFAPEARIKSRSKPAFHVQDVLKRDVSSYHGGGCARRSVRIRDTARDIFDVVFQYIYLAFADFSDGFSKTSCLFPLCRLRDHRTRRSSSCDNPHDELSGRACAAHHHCCRRQLRSIFSLMAFGAKIY